MEKRTYFCDFCGKEVRPYSVQVKAFLQNKSNKIEERIPFHIVDTRGEGFDICIECLNDSRNEVLKVMKIDGVTSRIKD